MTRVVIAGASVGGVRTAQSLRSAGYDGHIVLLDRESELPYDKPPLSKGLLSGELHPDAARLLTMQDADRLDVELRLGVATTGLEPEARRVLLADGAQETYDHLVIATGAVARWGPWADRRGDGVHVVRSLADTTALREDLELDGPVVVIGAGFVGVEVAATARRLGREVHVVDPLETPMRRAFEAGVGERFARLHRDHGVRCHLGVAVSGVDGRRGALSVRLSDGTVLPAAVVVLGIGATPNTAWLTGSGLDVQDGVLCDVHLRAEGADGIFAVGDVARWRDRADGPSQRAEHWTNAVDQAACVAHNIVAPDDLRAYRAVEYVWTDQYDWKIQSVGRHEGAATSARLGDVDGERFAVLYADDAGAVCGAVIANWPRALVAARKAVRLGAPLAEITAKLEEPASPRIGASA